MPKATKSTWKSVDEVRKPKAVKHAPGYYVVIYESGIGGDVEVKRLGPYASKKLADKADSGANRNLNHERFFTLTESIV